MKFLQRWARWIWWPTISEDEKARAWEMGYRASREERDELLDLLAKVYGHSEGVLLGPLRREIRIALARDGREEP